MKASIIPSPLGPLLALTGDRGRLVRLELPGGRSERALLEGAPAAARDDAAAAAVARQLDLYFAGALRAFDLDLALVGTPFQQQVWRALREIPYGRTWSYGELARRIGRPGAARAVGLANGRNPLPIVVPCHRVIGAGGGLTGYGGGLDAKRFLLALEGERPAEVLQGQGA